MGAILEIVGALGSPLGMALATAMLVYFLLLFVGTGLTSDAKDTLTLWLWGEYEATWAQQFNKQFELIFGDSHFSWRSLFASVGTSLISVLVLSILFVGPSGVLVERMGVEVPVVGMLFLAVIFNLVPDYLSLMETRWLLRRFEKTDSVPAQLCVLLVDIVVSLGIFWGCVYVLVQSTQLLEVMPFWSVLLGFAPISILLYSTLAGSVWAWLYLLSTWLMRLFAKTRWGRIQDVETEPGKAIAKVVSAIVFFVTFLLVWLPTGDGQVEHTVVDRFFCDHISSDVCVAIGERAQLEGVKNKYFEQACDEGDVIGCRRLGELLLTRNREEAKRLFRLGCDEGDLKSCRLVTFLSSSAEISDERKAEIYKHLCDASEYTSCVELGIFHLRGALSQSDPEFGVGLLQQTCRYFRSEGCSELGLLHQKGALVPLDLGLAVEYFEQGCRARQFLACNNLGWALETGEGVDVDLKRAAELYRLSCNEHIGFGCNNLARFHLLGIEVMMDVSQAGLHYERGCELGHRPSCVDVASLTLLEIISPYDNTRAVEVLVDSCELEEFAACHVVGTVYETGEVVDLDTAKAEMYYGIACENDVFVACNDLAVLVARLTGMGFSESSIRLLKLACENGVAPACYNLSFAYADGFGVQRDRNLQQYWHNRYCEIESLGSGCEGVLSN